MNDSNPPQSGGNGKPKAAEPDFLARQQEEARRAMKRVISGAGLSLAQGANVKQWAREYPWMTTASAAAAGFLAGLMLTPAKGQSFKEKFSSHKETASPASSPSVAASESAAAAPRQSDKASIIGTLAREIFKVVGPLVAGLVSQYASTPASGNGSSNGGAGAASADSSRPEGFGVYRDSYNANSPENHG